MNLIKGECNLMQSICSLEQRNCNITVVFFGSWHKMCHTIPYKINLMKIKKKNLNLDKLQEVLSKMREPSEEIKC